ncbi:Panacea domain-containing protein [Chryseobacterium lathyri]|uniref:Phage-associated protein n=1 Tax=Chryseobacterium lathyri TaxID=395933 RepID=A0ABT9SQZ8_9FLAO|nr:type II toxin-antitoxin system antitoxin SocA domain-containing protein [Chryseobacterium lathyri]MDP9961861.1 putative phage-associated protein [Chryseobacterium lathyri]
MYNCFDIAKQFLKYAKEEGIDVEPMKLLKLTYIAHGWHLGFYSKPLINNTIEAWKFGPVIPDLYHITKRFGFSNVDYDTISMRSSNKLSENEEKFIKVIWENYKQFSGLDLSTKTHLKGTPWFEVYDGTFNKVIDNQTIEKYYKDLIANPTNDTTGESN